MIAPSGWNLIFSIGIDPSAIDLWYKITDASDVTATGHDFGFASNREGFRGYIYRISGSDISNPFLASGSEIRFSNQTYNDRLDFSIGDSLLFAVHAHRGGTWGTDVINNNGWSLLTSFDCGNNQAEKETFYNVFENAGRSNTPEIDLLRTYNVASAVLAIKPAIEPPSWGIQNSVVVSKNIILKG